MTIAANLSRITELLEVLTEVVVEKKFADVEDNYGNNTYCDKNCHSAFENSSDNEADIEFIASQVAGETFHELNTWLGQQINWSRQNRKNAEANAFELVFDKVQRFLKGER